MSQPRISVIVPARDAEPTLRRTLECLAAQELSEPYEVVVVDDGSRDSTAELVERAGVPFRLVRGRGTGSSDARNLGVAEAHGALLAFTDADCFPSMRWLSALASAAEEADLVVGRVLPDPEADLGPFDRTVWVERETGLYETANLAMRRELFERIGGFESWLVDAGPRAGWTNPELGEDVWLGWRAVRAGARTAFAPEALVHHAVHTRGAAGYVSERRRLRHFPALAERVPELRQRFFYGRVFLGRRTAAFDAALAGLGAAAITRSPLPLVAAAPYARHLARRSIPYRRRAPLVAAVEMTADAVGLASLLRGSVRSRTPLL